MTDETISSTDRRSIDPLGRAGVTRHDVVLAIIPVAFLAGLLLATLANLPPRLGLVGAGMVGGMALLDGLFLNPPRGRRAGRGGG